MTRMFLMPIFTLCLKPLPITTVFADSHSFCSSTMSQIFIVLTGGLEVGDIISDESTTFASIWVIKRWQVLP